MDSAAASGEIARQLQRSLAPVDSLTHIAIGSAIGMAIMGARVPRWRAALWASVCTTLPDLDKLVHHGDAIRDMTFHRGHSHSLLWLTLLAPLVAWAISRIHREASLFRRWWLLAWLALISHPLLDVMTVYGTQLLLPFTDRPFGVGSVFIIDPLVTLPVVLSTLTALFWKSPRALRWNAVALMLSVLYLAWTLAAHRHATRVARATLVHQGVEAELLGVFPTPLNSVLWRVVAITPTSYVEGYYSLLDSSQSISYRELPRDNTLYERLHANWNIARIAWFTHGFFLLEEREGVVLITDLRLGMDPYYAFSFAVFENRGERLFPLTPRRISTVPANPIRIISWACSRMHSASVGPLPGAL